MSTTADLYKPEHLTPWEKPDCYSGARWYGWYSVIGQHRDSDALSRANFDETWARLKHLAEVPIVSDDEDERDMASIQRIRENHWAVGWVEWIGIHESNTEALKIADEIKRKLEDYPVVCENRWSEYESEEASQVWKDCYDAKKRIAYIREYRSQFEFHDFSEMLAVVRGKYFNGYASELLN